MFIPLRTNRPPKRRPLVTESLIILNMLVYLAGLAAEVTGVFDRELLIRGGHLARTDFQVWQLLTYQFLHDPQSILHLAFNMLFLWVFGCAVEDRLGRVSFLAFYLLGGSVAGLAHMMFEPNPVIGASGAVAAITGGFLALFPRSEMIAIGLFPVFGIIRIPAAWVILFFFALDLARQLNVIALGGMSNVAYMAHIAGYLYGFLLAFTLLGLRIVKREEFDVFYLFKQSRRRAAFRAANRSKISGPWESAAADTGRRIEKEHARRKPSDASSEAEATQRAEITELAAAHKLDEAATQYAALLEARDVPAFPDHLQLDLANALHHQERHDLAAKAYEIFLKRYPASPSAAEVCLLLGITYLRHLEQPARAQTLLQQAIDRLTDDDQKELARAMLDECGSEA